MSAGTRHLPRTAGTTDAAGTQRQVQPSYRVNTGAGKMLRPITKYLNAHAEKAGRART